MKCIERSINLYSHDNASASEQSHLIAYKKNENESPLFQPQTEDSQLQSRVTHNSYMRYFQVRQSKSDTFFKF